MGIGNRDLVSRGEAAPAKSTTGSETIEQAAPTGPVGAIDSSAVDSPTRCSSLAFHPSFATRAAGDDVILASSSSISFYTSWSLLKAHSSFFEGIASLPQTDEIGDRPVIDLPSATTDALAAALTLITPDKSIDWLIAHSLSFDGAPFCRIIQELCAALVDAYDLENVLAILPSTLDDDPWLRFALAALANDEPLAVSISSETVQLEIGMVPAARRLLLDLAPASHARLKELHSTRRAAWNQCKIRIRHHQDMENHHNDFAKNCRKRSGCSSLHQYGGSWQKLRRRAANAAVGAIRVGPKDMRSVQAMIDAVEGELDCSICAYRGHMAFIRAMEATLGGLPSSI